MTAISDPDDRFFLRIEVAHACRSSDDTSRRLRDSLGDRARAGRPHNTPHRPFGYAQDGVTVIEHEAAIAREIFACYLDGVSPRKIAQRLAERGEVTAGGKEWQPQAVRGILLKSRHLTGIRVFRGQGYGDGDWPAIIGRGTWTEAQDRRAYRASAHDCRASRFYRGQRLDVLVMTSPPEKGGRCLFRKGHVLPTGPGSGVRSCLRASPVRV